ncbi:hypothetical protein ACLVWQ_39345 [Streptomyces sp. CWNU-52B]
MFNPGEALDLCTRVLTRHHTPDRDTTRGGAVVAAALSAGGGPG